MDATIDISNLAIDDIREEYVLLKERYTQLRNASENDAQRIYELKRSLDTALATQQYLTQELEQSNISTSDAQLTGLKAEIEELKRKHGKLLEEHENLQQFSEETVQENARLTKVLEVLKTEQLSKKSHEETEIEVLAAKERTERLRLLEEENLKLLQKLNELHEENMQQQLMINDKQNAVENLRDNLQCLEENLCSKRNELEEKTQMLESAQEQLCEANSKIAMLTTAPENEERKGNSLFAEVDDQRQQMRQLLAAQKRSYLEMKKIYQDSQYEIRRLKNENIAMHKELEACTTLFCSANKSYQNKLLERLSHANNEKERLEQQLHLMHTRLIDLGNKKEVNWLDSMLSYCKQETDELKKQLHSSRLQQASVEEQLRNASQELACWRFEALKSRCVLLDREQLLNNNNIAFKPKNAIEFRMAETEVLEASPRILSANTKVNTPTTMASNTEDKVSESENNECKKEVEETGKTVESIKVEAEEETGTEVEVEELKKLDIEIENIDIDENKENVPIEIMESKQAVASIFSKARGLLNNETKSVTFSAAPPLVHQITPRQMKQVDATTKDDLLSVVELKDIKTRQIKKKSGLVIVRNIVLKPTNKQNN